MIRKQQNINIYISFCLSVLLLLSSPTMIIFANKVLAEDNSSSLLFDAKVKQLYFDFIINYISRINFYTGYRGSNFVYMNGLEDIQLVDLDYDGVPEIVILDRSFNEQHISDVFYQCYRIEDERVVQYRGGNCITRQSTFDFNLPGGFSRKPFKDPIESYNYLPPFWYVENALTEEIRILEIGFQSSYINNESSDYVKLQGFDDQTELSLSSNVAYTGDKQIITLMKNQIDLSSIHEFKDEVIRLFNQWKAFEYQVHSLAANNIDSLRALSTSSSENLAVQEMIREFLDSYSDNQRISLKNMREISNFSNNVTVSSYEISVYDSYIRGENVNYYIIKDNSNEFEITVLCFVSSNAAQSWFDSLRNVDGKSIGSEYGMYGNNYMSEITTYQKYGYSEYFTVRTERPADLYITLLQNNILVRAYSPLSSKSEIDAFYEAMRLLFGFNNVSFINYSNLFVNQAKESSTVATSNNTPLCGTDMYVAWNANYTFYIEGDQLQSIDNKNNVATIFEQKGLYKIVGCTRSYFAFVVMNDPEQSTGDVYSCQFSSRKVEAMVTNIDVENIHLDGNYIVFRYPGQHTWMRKMMVYPIVNNKFVRKYEKEPAFSDSKELWLTEVGTYTNAWFQANSSIYVWEKSPDSKDLYTLYRYSNWNYSEKAVISNLQNRSPVAFYPISNKDLFFIDWNDDGTCSYRILNNDNTIDEVYRIELCEQNIPTQIVSSPNWIIIYGFPNSTARSYGIFPIEPQQHGVLLQIVKKEKIDDNVILCFDTELTHVASSSQKDNNRDKLLKILLGILNVLGVLLLLSTTLSIINFIRKHMLSNK